MIDFMKPMRDAIDAVADERRIHDLEATLSIIDEWLGHWKRDAECNLAPTETSLNAAHERVRETLRKVRS